MRKYSSFNAYDARKVTVSNVQFRKAQTTKNQNAQLVKCKNLLWNCSLNAWETNFCKDIIKKIESKRIITLAQEETLGKIFNNHQAEYRDDHGEI